MGFSPDIDAVWCYLIVLLLGALSAARQVRQRVGAFKGAWAIARTWIVFITFIPIPVLLLWLLDRLGAVNDTSVFAAVILGVAYDRILAGGFLGIQAPEQLSGVWKTLSEWADKVSDKALERVQRNSARFDERVMSALRHHEDRFNAAKDLVLVRSSKPGDIVDNLDKLGKEAETLGAEVAHERKARFLFDEVSGLTDFHYLMKTKRIITRPLYYWHVLEWRTAGVAFLVAVLLVGALAWTLKSLDEPRNWLNYYAWRVTKSGTTPADLARARRELSALIADGECAEQAYARLTRSLGQPGIADDRIDVVIALLLENRWKDGEDSVTLPRMLTESLRADAVDTRLRVHRALEFLADERFGEIEGDGDPQRKTVRASLREWTPTDGDNAAAIESRVVEWRQVWGLSAS